MMLEGADEDEILLWFAILTNEKMNSAGTFRLPKLYLCADLKWSLERLKPAFKRLEDKKYFLYDEKTEVIFIRSFVNYHPPHNKNNQKGILKNMEMLPDSYLLAEYHREACLLEAYEDYDFSLLLEGLRKALAKGLPKGSAKGSGKALAKGLPKGSAKGSTKGSGKALATNDNENDNDKDNDNDNKKEKKKKRKKTLPQKTIDEIVDFDKDDYFTDLKDRYQDIDNNIPFDKIKQAFIEASGKKVNLVHSEKEKEYMRGFWVMACRTSIKNPNLSDDAWDLVYDVFENSQNT
ncbi:MAG: hypothetical protein K9L56_15480, partial [Clostridiales bacterium]|nr:hypothetical protein [Clostridiales bacterium]